MAAMYITCGIVPRTLEIVVKFTDEQYATINESTAGRFDPRVFVNCLQVEKYCERRLFIWLQSGDVTNVSVNKVNTDWFWYKNGSNTCGGCDWLKIIIKA